MRGKGLAIGATVVAAVLTVAAVPAAASTPGEDPLCGNEFTGFFTNTYAQTISGASPRDYYRLGEQPGGGAIPDGTVAHDQTGAADGTYHGNVIGGTEGALQCDPDTAVTFDGNGSAPGRVRLGTLTSVGDFTIEGWSYSTEGANGGTPNPNGNETLFGDFGSERLLVRPSAVYGDVIIGGVKYIVQVRTPSNTGAWIYWAFVRSGGTLTIYRALDGSGDGVRAVGTASGVPTSTIPLRGNIGEQANGSYPFQGGLDDIALYTRALSASDVAAHFQASVPKAPPPDAAG